VTDRITNPLDAEMTDAARYPTRRAQLSLMQAQPVAPSVAPQAPQPVVHLLGAERLTSRSR